MILSDFLSRQMNDDSNPHEIMPISFNMCQLLDDNYYSENYLVQTRSQAKSGGLKLPEIHGMGKNLDPNLKPENNMPCPNREIWKGHVSVREELDQEERDLIPSINQLINHPTCHENSLEDRNRNRKNKPCAYQRTDAFHKQHGWQDHKQ